ncbi:MAG: NAD(P)H-dependent oxidoreductase [Candidatus Moraniibacteriota bacterium]
MLIIYAHFDHNGHSGQVLQTVENLLKTKGKAYELLDLYAMGFDPIGRAGDMQRQADNLAVDEKIRQIQEKILKATELVVIYPTWWINVPAILKGFYDRVLAAGFAFRYGANGMPEGLLKGKRALVITTAGGPAFYHALLRNNRSLKATTADTLNFCGVKTQALLIGDCRKFDEQKKTEIQQKVLVEMEKFAKN